MVVVMKKLICLLAVLGLCAGCTSRQLYATGQAYQRNQCQQLPDPSERRKCLGKTDTSYDEYQRETNADKR